MPAKPSLTIETVLSLLVETPPRIAALTHGLSPAQLQVPPEENEWSANDVLAHLRACADVWGDCMMKIIAQDGLTIRAVNPRTWIKQTNYPEQKFQASLRAFSVQRTELLAVIQPLPRAGWSRSAKVTGAGSPLVLSVHSYAQRMARHERIHVKQIERIVKAMYT